MALLLVVLSVLVKVAAGSPAGVTVVDPAAVTSTVPAARLALALPPPCGMVICAPCAAKLSSLTILAMDRLAGVSEAFLLPQITPLVLLPSAPLVANEAPSSRAVGP